MWIVLCLELTFGLLASSWASSSQEVKVRSCSHSGVFYIQGNDRHSLTFEEAQQLCKSLDATLATAEQVTAAHRTGLEFCRYGWISDGNVTIVRQKPNPRCRSDQTGPIIFKPTENSHDALCYDGTDTSEKNCTDAINPESVADPPLPPTTTGTLNTTMFHVSAAEVTTVTPSIGNEEDPTQNPELSTEVDSTMATTALPDIKNSALMTSSSNQHEEKIVVDAQTTQSLIQENTEPDGHTEITATEISAQTETHTQMTVTDGAKKSATLMPGIESTGSGMGESTVPTTETTVTQDQDNSDSEETSMRETEDNEEDSTESEDKNTRGKMMLPPAEEDKSNSSSSDWLIIVCVIVAVAVILLICAAVATRKRWCGKSQTLMITSKSNSEGNGTAASASSSRAQEREQEMVTLMNKEKIQENGNTEEFTVITLEESPEKNQQA